MRCGSCNPLWIGLLEPSAPLTGRCGPSRMIARRGKHLSRGDAASEMHEDLRLDVILGHLARAGMFLRGVTLDEKRGQARAHIIRATGDKPAQRHPVDHALELLANSDAPHTTTVAGWRRFRQLSDKGSDVQRGSARRNPALTIRRLQGCVSCRCARRGRRSVVIVPSLDDPAALESVRCASIGSGVLGSLRPLARTTGCSRACG